MLQLPPPQSIPILVGRVFLDRGGKLDQAAPLERLATKRHPTTAKRNPINPKLGCSTMVLYITCYYHQIHPVVPKDLENSSGAPTQRSEFDPPRGVPCAFGPAMKRWGRVVRPKRVLAEANRSDILVQPGQIRTRWFSHHRDTQRVPVGQDEDPNMVRFRLCRQRSLAIP